MPLSPMFGGSTAVKGHPDIFGPHQAMGYYLIIPAEGISIPGEYYYKNRIIIFL